MARATVYKMQEFNKDFNVHSKHWAMTIERKFGAPASKQFTEVLNDQFESKQQLFDDLESKLWNDSIIMDTLHHDKTAYINPTFCNVFYTTLKAMINGEEYNSKLWTQRKIADRNLFDECLRSELEKVGCKKQVIMRITWRQNAFCLIYSRSNKKWCVGRIIKTYIDTMNEEWLVVKYGNKTKRIQRFCPYIKPMMINDNKVTSNAYALTLKSNISNQKLTHNNDDGFMFHFYGIMAPNKYKSKLKLHKNVNYDLLVSAASKLKRTDSIYSLKQFIRKIYNISSNYDILIVFGDNIVSYNHKVKLRSVGITNNSLLLLAIYRKSEYIKNICKKKDKLTTNKANTTTQWNYTLSIEKQRGFDIITQENNVDVYRMPNCGHYMNKDSLYEYCLNQSQDINTTHVCCPHHAQDAFESELKYEELNQWECRYCTFLNDDDESQCAICENAKPAKKVKCDMKWNYSLIKQILSFDDDEKWSDLVKLESLLSRNTIQKECDLQKCPGCKTLYFKEKYSQLDIKTANDIRKEFKTHCIRCDSWNNAFCFCCGDIWNYGHLCDSSFKSELITILNKADTKRIGEVENVPNIRCCPNCAQLIAHTEACKHMSCSSCDTEFCFVCLKPVIDVDGNDNYEWQCGSSGDVCPVAPRQCLKSLPNTVVINKKAFKLF